MKIFIQCILLIIAFSNAGLGQSSRPCNMKIKLVTKTSKSPIANQRFTLTFYTNTNTEVKKTECGPTDVVGETVVPIDMRPYYKCILSFPEGSNFDKAEFIYTTCTDKAFEISSKPAPNLDPDILIQKLKNARKDLAKARDEAKGRIAASIKDKKVIDSLNNVIRTLEEDIARASTIINQIEKKQGLTEEELRIANQLIEQKDAIIAKLNAKIDAIIGNTIRISDFTCQGFIDNTSLKFSIRLSNPEYSVDNESVPRKYKFRISLTATIAGNWKKENTRQIRFEDGLSEMYVEAMYPMKAFEDPIILVFKPLKADREFLSHKYEFDIKIDEVQSGNIAGLLHVSNTNLCTVLDSSDPNLIGKLKTDCKKISLELLDGGEPDGDIINLNWSGHPSIFENQTLTKNAIIRSIELEEGNNLFELEGVNSGSQAYEVSAAIKCYCGERGRLLIFQTGQGERNSITLFNHMSNAGGIVRNMAKKRFVIQYILR